MNIIKSDNLVTVLTPTYNRGEQLINLYKSLVNQSNNEFVWLIIDDGSTDRTEQLVEELIKENRITIEYIKRQNGGKHRALNTGIKMVKTELTFIVDSDDVLTEDAIQEIYDTWAIYRAKDICGISFLRGYNETKVIGDSFKDYCFIDTFNNVRLNKNVKGDKAEIWVTDYLKEVPFLEFDGEKFFSENYVWVNLSKKYSMVFVSKIIYITAYLEGGLTKSGRKLLISCPLGGTANANELLSREFSHKVRFKNALLFIVYSLFARKNILRAIESNENKGLLMVALPFAYIMFRYWKLKYD
ncbi:hypothetical protein A6P54_13415 [Bacillus sp. MKU004]|nr:hypothetical protein A6P54_13415 [Bacillus sp. MKU004]